MADTPLGYFSFCVDLLYKLLYNKSKAYNRSATSGVLDVLKVTGWWRGAVVSGVRRMNEVNPRRARLVPGWVTVFGRLAYNVSIRYQLTRST